MKKRWQIRESALLRSARRTFKSCAPDAPAEIRGGVQQAGEVPDFSTPGAFYAKKRGDADEMFALLWLTGDDGHPLFDESVSFRWSREDGCSLSSTELGAAMAGSLATHYISKGARKRGKG